MLVDNAHRINLPLLVFRHKYFGETNPTPRLLFIGSMMTSSNGNIIRVTGTLCGEFTGHRWIPSQRPVTRSFDAFFDPRLNRRLSKQAWLETPSRSLWRQCNVLMSSGLLHPWYIPCRLNRLLCPPMEGSRQPAPPQCWKNIENANISGFLKTIQHLND